MDLTTISTALSSIKTATEIAKLIKNSEDSLEQAESKLRLAELISSLAEARIQIAEVQQDLSEKDALINMLKLKIADKESFMWESPYYWRIEGPEKDGPYCQHCHDKNSEKIRLQSRDNGVWKCVACQNTFYDKTHQKKPRIIPNYSSEW
jgi:hypothetical protein